MPCSEVRREVENGGIAPDGRRSTTQFHLPRRVLATCSRRSSNKGPRVESGSIAAPTEGAAGPRHLRVPARYCEAGRPRVPRPPERTSKRRSTPGAAYLLRLQCTGSADAAK